MADKEHHTTDYDALCERLDVEPQRHINLMQVNHSPGYAYVSEEPSIYAQAAAAIRELQEQLAAANERAGKLNRQLVELQDAIDSRDKAAGFEEVPALSPEARHAFRAAVQEIDGVNLREVERVRKEHSECIDYYEAKLVEIERKLDEYSAEVERLRNALDWIADPRGNDICTPQEIAEAALGRAKP